MDKMPLGLEDFPPVVTEAITVFNSLGDRLLPELGYIGKDYSALPVILEMRGLEKSELMLDILLHLDKYAIEDNNRKMKAERDKIARGKNNGR